MIEIICYSHNDNTAHGRVYVNDVPFCDCLINKDKNGNFPYKFDHYYFLETHSIDKWRLRLVDHNNPLWSQRGFQIHIGNTLSDSKGCVLVGIFNLDDHHTLYLSKATFVRLVDVFNNVDNIVIFRDSAKILNSK